MPYSRRSSGSEAEYVLMPVHSHAGSEYGRSRRGGNGRRSPAEAVVNNYLGVPQPRPRASSAGGGPAPTIVNIGGLPSDRGHSHSRHRRHGSRYRSSSSSSCESSRSRSRHSRRRSERISEHELPYHLRREIDYGRMSRKEEEERKIKDEIKRAREEDRRRWQLEEEEEKIRKRKEKEVILLEAKLEEEKKKEEQEALRKKILKDEEERIQREKEKKKKEEEEFERKVKEKFMKAGYSAEYIEEVLHKKKEEQATLAIDLHRPTYIKVNRKYLHPDTLDAYGLPWEWDGRDEEFIIIKKYIDHNLQDELFEHTRRLKERKLITGPYIKETKTITTLTPNDVVKKGDRMYLVREKSKSPARSRRSSWMFT
ncbi:uncharacterized protein Z518_10866 [Rhinocladiella mackenziei CBS 650.93]|uniref:Uncharacterized protein n=1 Tax=Rhinocladiella mackenziei CBS 650.93 TaxID=1442369 RepID=A0A0D2I2G8_9EURO|nr:uncharacterized protein Z518_10866 [Rhinocladiella mackenziei CBS 650.93]KIW99938.1 hypothetical protein Z518_10866 [Rhinocladiella mackenziei CBS 650.93]